MLHAELAIGRKVNSTDNLDEQRGRMAARLMLVSANAAGPLPPSHEHFLPLGFALTSRYEVEEDDIAEHNPDIGAATFACEVGCRATSPSENERMRHYLACRIDELRYSDGPRSALAHCVYNIEGRGPRELICCDHARFKDIKQMLGHYKAVHRLPLYDRQSTLKCV